MWSARVVPAAVAGVLVGLAAVGVLIVADVLEVDRTVDGREAEEAFLEAWARYRTGTFVVENDWRRERVDSDAPLESATMVAQSPPDRILRGFGGVRGRLDDRPIRCSTDFEGIYRCFPADAVLRPYHEELKRELRTFRRYFRGVPPIYEVSIAADGCFELDLLYPLPDPSYGVQGRLCFDDETGALREIERDFGYLVERVEAVTIRSEVTPEDFSMSVDDRFDLEGLPEWDPARERLGHPTDRGLVRDRDGTR